MWQRGIDLAEAVYRLTADYPSDERFGLVSQSRRAAASVPANIAEGQGRGTPKAFAAFLRISRGSLKELETHLLLAERVGATPSGSTDALLADTDELGRMLQGLIKRQEASTHPSPVSPLPTSTFP